MSNPSRKVVGLLVLGAVYFMLGSRGQAEEVRKTLNLAGEWRMQATDGGDPVEGNWKTVDFVGAQLSGKTVWVERDVEVPGEFAGLETYLVIDALNGSPRNVVSVWVNGTDVGGTRPWGYASLDISGFVKPGRNTIRIGGAFTGLIGKIRLEARPTDINIEPPLIDPLVSEGRLRARVPLSCSRTTQLEVTATARLWAGDGNYGPPIALGTGKLNIAPAENNLVTGLNRVPVTFSVDNKLKTWDWEHPNLYLLDLEFRSGGRVIDTLNGTRFGYREITINDKQLLLNGHPILLRGNSHNFLKNYDWKTSPVLPTWRAVGWNTDRTFQPQLPSVYQGLPYADEQGHMVTYNTQADLWDGDQFANERWEVYTVNQRIHNDPSVIAYQKWSNGLTMAPHGHPAQMAAPFGPPAEVARNNDLLVEGMFPEKDAQDLNPIYLDMVALHRKSHEMDPTRPVYWYRSGTGPDFNGGMYYYDVGMPIQDIAEVVSFWAENGTVPLVQTEAGPTQAMFEGFTWWDKESKSLIVEHLARRHGPDIYNQISQEQATDLSAAKWINNPHHLRFMNDYVERVIPVWRTYGAGFLIHTWYQAIGQAPNLSVMGNDLASWNADTLVWLGGEAPDFANQDCNYQAGETIRKQLIVQNDARHAVNVSYKVEGVGFDIKPVTGTAKVDIGETKMIPVEFTAPAPKQRLFGHLVLTALFDNQTVTREIPISVWTASNNAAIPNTGKVLLFNPARDGATDLMMKKLGVAAAPFSGDLAGAKALIIGRRALNAETMKTLADSGLEDAVRAGLRVLVLEQTGGGFLGLVQDQLKSRSAYPLARHHPVVEGLVDNDLTNWRGDSDLLSNHQRWVPIRTTPEGKSIDWKENKFSKDGQWDTLGKQRFYQWSNSGMVSNFTFYKPQAGGWMPLLENEFDLIYSPLVQRKLGKGLIIANSLNLTERFGKDPAATEIARRLVSYVLSDKTESPTRPILYIGEGGQGLANMTGVQLARADDDKNVAAIVVNAKADLSGKMKRIQEALQVGTPVLVFNASSSDQLKWVGANVQVEKRQVWAGSIPEDPLLDGVGASSCFLREVTELPVVTGASDAVIGSGGLVSVIRHGTSKVILLQLVPFDVTEPWQRAKIAQMYSAILAGLGASFDTPLDMTYLATDKVAPPGTYPFADEDGHVYTPFDAYVHKTW